ncbi:MAG: sialidase family protein, partial [Chloroflexi bacterium]|nr:sialidase family protein [Chloroflexota bacterium]
MKVVLIVAAVAAGLVVAILAFGSGDEGAGGRPRFARETSTNGLQGPSLASAPSLDTPSASDGLATARPTTASAPPRAMIVSGPYLVSDDYLSGPTLPANQQRVFRAPDGTIVALHHRLGGPKDDLHQIVMVHSHDGGRSWHGELDVGTEAPDATYSGVMDARGNLYVAYGRDATGPSGGAIKLRVLTYQDDLHTWRAGPENRVLWDWPGRGATSPTLTFHGDRLWLAYRYYTEAGYAIVTQYADLNSDGNYSASQWSSAIALTEPQESPTVHASLVSHGTRLSAFSTTGDSGVLWRLLSDPGGSPRAWTTPMWVFTSIDQGQEARFSAVADSGGNIHLVVAVEGLFVSHLKYDGIEWSRIRQLAVNNVFGPSIATDGQNIWTFWQKRQASGYSRIQVRPWVEEQGWDRVATTPWAEQFGKPFPSVLVYKERRGSYTDVTRYAANPAGSSGGQAVTVAGLLERPGDILYLGNDEKFYNLPLTLDQVETDAPLADLEYWDGSGWVNLPLAVESPEATNGSLTLDTTIGFLPPVDWEPTDVNGVTRFYLRLRKDSPGVSSLAAFRIISPLQVSGLIAASKPSNMIDLLWSERPRDSDGGRLWYGSVSFDNLNSESSVPEHSHKRLLARGPSALSGALDAVSLPEGSPGQFVSVSLDEGESHEFQLLDGQVRYVKVLDTQRVFRSPEAVTVWATATVEVGGPGLATQKEVIPVAYFQPPVVLNGVRIYVEITKDFNDGRLVNGGGTTKAARLMLSDAGYSLTDLTQYRWP